MGNKNKILNGDIMKTLYEVVCTKSYLDVGLLIEKNNKSKPKRVLARTSTYGSNEYGGVETVTWINTGVFLTKDEWKDISYNKGTSQILKELGIIEPIIEKERKKDMTVSRQVVDDRAFEKNYNIEWYLGNGQIRTTSAVMTAIENGYIFFRYPSGGIFVLKDDAIRSLECVE